MSRFGKPKKVNQETYIIDELSPEQMKEEIANHRETKKRLEERGVIKTTTEKKKRRTKEEAAEAREKELRDKLNLQAELKQMLYDLYMKNEITSKFSSEMRAEIDSGKMTEDELKKLIKEHKKSFGKPVEEERGRSPSPEPVKRGRPKKVKSPERSKSPEPKPKKKIDYNSMTPEQVKKIQKLIDMTTALQLNEGVPDSVAKILNKQINNGTIDTVAEFKKVSKKLIDDESKKPKEIKKASAINIKEYMNKFYGEEEIPKVNKSKEKEETPSSIVKSSKSLKDALKQPVKQLDIMTATVKAKLDVHDKVMIDTYLKLRKDLTAKEKKAVRLSIDNEINDKMKGSGLSHPMHQIYGYGVNRTEDALEYFQHVKRLFGKI